MAKKHEESDRISTVGPVTATGTQEAQLPIAVTIAVPIGDVPQRKHFFTHIDVRLTAKQGEVLQKIAAGLRGTREELDNGVVFCIGRNGEPRGSFANAVQWLLEQIAEEANR